MQTLSLLINTEFSFNENNQIKILRNANPDNAFKIEPDGIWLDASLIASGNGFVDGGGAFLRIGFKTPFDYGTASRPYPQPGRIVANNTVHRFYTAEENGSIIDLRSQIDFVLPGDIVRVPATDDKFTYKLVTAISEDPYSITYATLGTW